MGCLQTGSTESVAEPRHATPEPGGFAAPLGRAALPEQFLAREHGDGATQNGAEHGDGKSQRDLRKEADAVQGRAERPPQRLAGWQRDPRNKPEQGHLAQWS